MKAELKKRSVGDVAAFKPDNAVRAFLEDYCSRENRSVSNALETIVLASEAFHAWKQTSKRQSRK